MTEKRLLELYLKHSELGEVSFDQFKGAITEYESAEIERLQGIIDKISPFLSRLQEPRYDKDETNDYVCGSTDCQIALKAMRDYIEAKKGGE